MLTEVFEGYSWMWCTPFGSRMREGIAEWEEGIVYWLQHILQRVISFNADMYSRLQFFNYLFCYWKFFLKTIGTAWYIQKGIQLRYFNCCMWLTLSVPHNAQYGVWNRHLPENPSYCIMCSLAFHIWSESTRKSGISVAIFKLYLASMRVSTHNFLSSYSSP